MKKKNKIEKAEKKPVNVEELLMYYENRALKRDLFAANLELMESRRRYAEQKKTARKEMDSFMGFVGLVSLLVVFGCCLTSGAPWTAVFIALGCGAVMRKAGWI